MKISIEKVKCFPNPAQDYINFNWTNPSSREGQISIYNISGRRMFAAEFKSGSILRVNTGSWPAGAYYYRLKKAGNFLNGRFMLVE